jgi:hypothetical protein
VIPISRRLARAVTWGVCGTHRVYGSRFGQIVCCLVRLFFSNCCLPPGSLSFLPTFSWRGLIMSVSWWTRCEMRLRALGSQLSNSPRCSFALCSKDSVLSRCANSLSNVSFTSPVLLFTFSVWTKLTRAAVQSCFPHGWSSTNAQPHDAGEPGRESTHARRAEAYRRNRRLGNKIPLPSKCLAPSSHDSTSSCLMSSKSDRTTHTLQPIDTR